MKTMDLMPEALAAASDHGARRWLKEPTLTENTFGGHDLRVGDTTYRTADDDGMTILYVMTGGNAMLLAERATFTPGLAHLAVAQVAEALR